MSPMQDFGFFLSRVLATTKARNAACPEMPGKYFVTDAPRRVAVATIGSPERASNGHQKSIKDGA
jgi:hypothetical protein